VISEKVHREKVNGDGVQGDIASFQNAMPFCWAHRNHDLWHLLVMVRYAQQSITSMFLCVAVHAALFQCRYVLQTDVVQEV
jgi:hypothetical protein